MAQDSDPCAPELFIALTAEYESTLLEQSRAFLGVEQEACRSIDLTTMRCSFSKLKGEVPGMKKPFVCLNGVSVLAVAGMYMFAERCCKWHWSSHQSEPDVIITLSQYRARQKLADQTSRKAGWSGGHTTCRTNICKHDHVFLLRISS